MIKFEITNSPDEEVLGTHEYHFNEMTFGRGKKSDFIISDSKLMISHIKLTSENNHLKVENIHKDKTYMSNGHKVSGKKSHKNGDLIKIGETEIKILDFKLIELHRPEQSKNVNLERLGEIFQALDEEIIHIENDPNI